ncbi:unnamed protein product [Choristocarpus tenellus]
MRANRRARRFSPEKGKGGSPKNKPSSSGSDAKWLQVLSSEPDLKPSASMVVSGKYKGDELYFSLARQGGRIFAVSEACGRCKFPMINGKVTVESEPGGGGELVDGEDPEAVVSISCPLCGAKFDMSTGDICC